MTENLVRLKRVCDVCGGVDDHPRHQISFEKAEQVEPPSTELIQKVTAAVDVSTEEGVAVLRDLFDRGVQLRHMDCCKSVGCPTGDCNRTLSGVPEGTTGMDLVDHIQELHNA